MDQSKEVECFYKMKWIKIKDTISKMGSFKSKLHTRHSREDLPRQALSLIEDKFYSVAVKDNIHSHKPTKELTKLLCVHAYHTKPKLQDVSLSTRSLLPHLSSSSLLIPETADGYASKLLTKKQQKKKRQQFPEIRHSFYKSPGSANSTQPLSDQDKLRLRRYFRGMVKVILAFKQIWKYHMGRVNEILKSFNVLDAIAYAPPEEKHLMFDSSAFKASRQTSVSSETKRILQMHPTMRGSDEIHHLLVAFGNYDSLAEYPMQMQRLIAQKAFYEFYDAKRVIVREGHPAYTFFYVLSGSAVMTVYDKDTEESKAVGYIQRGGSFGERSLMNSKPQECTTISKEPVEFLTLCEEDFIEIFMSNGLKQNRHMFIQSLPFMAGWPVEVLLYHPQKAMFTYYKSGQVVVRDSATSEWIYIIKSGECTVLKRLELRDVAAIDKMVILGRSSHKESRMLTEARLLNKDELQEKVQMKLELLLQNDMADKEKLRSLAFSDPIINVPINGMLDKYKDAYFKQTSVGNVLKNTKDENIGSPDAQKKSSTSVFITVQTLGAGSHFGLIQAVASNMVHPSLSLVSQGAEVVVIHRKLYMEYAPRQLIQSLREKIFPYPSDETLQLNLDISTYWTKHKQAVVDQCTRQKRIE